LFGSNQTKNHLASQGCYYNNIEIVTGLGLVTWDLIKHINSISPSDITRSDWLNTLVLAADMLKKETQYVYCILLGRIPITHIVFLLLGVFLSSV